MRAFDLACQTPWAITQGALQGILTIAARENLPVEAVEAQLGRPLDNTHSVTQRGRVASIPVEGPLFRRANMLTRVSGATDIETLAQDFTEALDNPTVSAILFAIDSPGGEINGVAEFADMIYAARGRKSITAYISDMGASAAYWIASACSQIVVAQTAAVGSIGVVAAVPDPSRRSASTVQFVSSQSPHKRPDPTTDAGRAQLQRHVDSLGAIFVGAVARNRGVTAERVRADFGGGALFVGREAVTAGLVDRVGSYEECIASLNGSGGAYAQPLRAAQTGAYSPTATATVPGRSYSSSDLDATLAYLNNGRTPTGERRRELLARTAAGREILAREDA